MRLLVYFRNSWRAAALIVLLIGIAGCSVVQNLQDNMQRPALSVEDMQITGINFQQMEMVYDIKVENPNPVGVQLQSYDYELDIADHMLFQGDEPDKTEVEASGESIIQVPVTISFSDIYQSIAGLADADEVPYHFSSNFTFDLPVLGQTELPVEHEGSIPLLKMPKLNVQALQVKNLSLSQANLNLKMQFDNPNGFGLNINHLNYDLIINGDQWAEGKALENVSIKENGATELNIPVSLNITQVGMSAYRMISGSDSLNFRLKGNFNMNGLHELMGETNFDFDRSGKVSLSGN